MFILNYDAQIKWDMYTCDMICGLCYKLVSWEIEEGRKRERCNGLKYIEDITSICKP